MKLARRLPSLSRDFALFVAAVVAAAAVLCAWLTWNIYRLESERIGQHLATEAAGIEQAFAEPITYGAHLMDYLREQISRDAKREPEYVAGLLKIFENNPKAQELFSWSMFDWIAPDGRVIAGTKHGVHKDAIYASKRAYLKKAVEQPGVIQFSAPDMGLVSGQWIIPTGMGVLGPKGDYLGLVSVGFDVKSIATRIQRVADKEISYAIFDMDLNQVLEFPENSGDISRGLLKARAEAGDLRASGVLSAPGFMQEGTDFIVYHATGEFPFLIVVRYSGSLHAERIKQALFPRVAEVMALGAFLLLLLFLLRARLIKPVIELSEAADKIARGETEVAVPRGGTQELETLSGQITRISRYIREHHRIEQELQRQKKELEKAKDMAESANRTQSMFLACMSHELRTPLNAIIAFSEALKRELFGPINNQKYREYIGDIHLSGSHLLQIINDILDLSKAEAGMIELREEEVDLRDVIAHARALLGDRAEKGGIEIAVEAEPNLPLLRADPLRLRQIVLNLLSNAVKFTHEGGKVTIAARREFVGWEVSGLTLSVRDTGIGMRKEDIPKALTKFGQIDSGLERKYPGTGLGLPLARELAELHGATLTVESEPGKGTLVTVRFPAGRLGAS